MILSVCANPSVDSFWHVDQVKRNTTNRSTGESFYPGGKGVHVAFALNELGAEVSTLGVWGGQTGAWLRQECRRQQIIPVGPSVEQWTRLCITTKSSTPWADTELLGAGPEVKPDEVQAFTDTYREMIEEQPQAVTISGSVPHGMDSDIYRRLINMAATQKIPTFLDASGELLKNALSARPYSIHINQHEGQALFHTTDPKEISRRLASNCSIAAVTAGDDGLYLTYENTIYHAWYTLDPSRIISTVGSGDCLLAGLCLATLQYDNPEVWASMGAACGSANCIHPALGMLKADDVRGIADKITLETLTI